MSRQFQETATGEIESDADGHDQEDYERVVFEVVAFQIERLTRIASGAKHRVGNDGEEHEIVRSPGPYFARGHFASVAKERAVEMETDALAEEGKSQPAAQQEDGGGVEPEEKDLAAGDGGFGGAGSHIGESAVAGQKISEGHLHEDDEQNNDGR